MAQAHPFSVKLILVRRREMAPGLGCRLACRRDRAARRPAPVRRALHPTGRPRNTLPRRPSTRPPLAGPHPPGPGQHPAATGTAVTVAPLLILLAAPTAGVGAAGHCLSPHASLAGRNSCELCRTESAPGTRQTWCAPRAAGRTCDYARNADWFGRPGSGSRRVNNRSPAASRHPAQFQDRHGLGQAPGRPKHDGRPPCM